MFAVMHSRVNVVRALLNAGANWFLENGVGRSAEDLVTNAQIQEVFDEKNKDFINWFLSNEPGHDIDDIHMSDQRRAAFNEMKAEFLVARARHINALDRDLVKRAREGDVTNVSELLRKGADPAVLMTDIEVFPGETSADYLRKYPEVAAVVEHHLKSKGGTGAILPRTTARAHVPVPPQGDGGEAAVLLHTITPAGLQDEMLSELYKLTQRVDALDAFVSSL
jgi:hypothetical protein